METEANETPQIDEQYQYWVNKPADELAKSEHAFVCDLAKKLMF